MELSLFSLILLTWLCQYRSWPERSRTSLCGFLVCVSSFLRHERVTHTEHFTSTGAYPQTGSLVSENSVEQEHGSPWEPGDWYSSCSDDSSTSAWCNSRYTAWMASVPLDLAHHPTHVVLDLGCTRSTGSRKAIRRFQKYVL